MKIKIFSFVFGVLLGICLIIGISLLPPMTTSVQATGAWVHLQNVDPNPLLKGTKDIWYGHEDGSTALSLNVGESWKGNVWNNFEVWFETASDTWKHSELGYTYTNLHYDAFSRADTLQMTLTGGATAGGHILIEATDWDGI
jgi:hypothetical protein